MLMTEHRELLPALAAEIEQEHQAAHRAGLTMIEHAKRCGDLLIKAKAEVGHGEWLPWLDANVSFCQRTAQGYMKLARELPRLDSTNAQRVADLSLRDALAALARQSADLHRLPESAATQAIDKAAGGERLKDSLTRELNQQKGSTHRQDNPEWFRAELPPQPPAPPHDNRLAALILVAIKKFDEVDVPTVLETLNAIYCALQEGRTIDKVEQILSLSEHVKAVEGRERRRALAEARLAKIAARNRVTEPEVEVIEAERVEVAMPGRMRSVASISDAEMVDDVPHPDAELRRRVEALTQSGATDATRLASRAGVPLASVELLLSGRTAPYNDRREILKAADALEARA
jgi:hypothetical protein